MLSKSERLGARGMKARVIRSGRFRFGSVKILATPPAAAVVVSKKVSPSAPVRNRIRRRLAAILRALIRSGAVSGGVIVYPDKSILLAPTTELRTELERALGIR